MRLLAVDLKPEMKPPMKIPAGVLRLLRIGFAVALPLLCGGCELLPLATLSTLFGIAGAAVSTGPVVYEQGKLDIAFMANYGDIQQAVRLAAVDLNLHLKRDRSKSADSWDFQLQDDQKSKIEVTIERRTPMLARCRIDVGLLGSQPTAQLVLNRIRSHLPTGATAVERK